MGNPIDLDALDWKRWPKDPLSRYVDLPIGWRLSQSVGYFHLRQIDENGQLMGPTYNAETSAELFDLLARIETLRITTIEET